MVFPLRGGCFVPFSVELGFVPGVGVDVERGEAVGLERVAAGDDVQGVVAGVAGDAPDALQRVEASTGGEVLVGQVGVAYVVHSEVGSDERFDDRAGDADGDVAADALFGPVEHGPQREKVFEDPEAVLDS